MNFWWADSPLNHIKDRNPRVQQFTHPPSTTTKHRKDSSEERMKRDATDLDEVNSKPIAWSLF